MNQKIIDEIAALRVEQERIKNRLNGIEHNVVQVSVMATELYRSGFSLKLDR